MGDTEFAAKCRRAILEQGGVVVVFPQLPTVTDETAQPNSA
jgi:hypothetical protein